MHVLKFEENNMKVMTDSNLSIHVHVCIFPFPFPPLFSLSLLESKLCCMEYRDYLRLFIVVSQELHCLLQCLLFGVFIEKCVMYVYQVSS